MESSSKIWHSSRDQGEVVPLLDYVVCLSFHKTSKAVGAGCACFRRQTQYMDEGVSWRKCGAFGYGTLGLKELGRSWGRENIVEKEPRQGVRISGRVTPREGAERSQKRRVDWRPPQYL